jgi:putative addiction module antidote
MTRNLKIRRVGGSLGAIFPKELLEELNVTEGDELTVLRRGTDFTLTKSDPDLDKIMDAFEVIRKRYHNTLQKLAE